MRTAAEALLALALLSGTATESLKERLALLSNPEQGSPEKAQPVLDAFLDYGAFDRGTLGRAWEQRTEEEKARFSPLLKLLVRQAMLRTVQKIAGRELEFGAEQQAGDGILVPVKVSSREESIDLQFRMKSLDGTWKVQDLITEGVGLVASYRSQFTKILERDGFEVLIRKMKAKADANDR